MAETKIITVEFIGDAGGANPRLRAIRGDGVRLCIDGSVPIPAIGDKISVTLFDVADGDGVNGSFTSELTVPAGEEKPPVTAKASVKFAKKVVLDADDSDED